MSSSKPDSRIDWYHWLGRGGGTDDIRHGLEIGIHGNFAEENEPATEDRANVAKHTLSLCTTLLLCKHCLAISRPAHVLRAKIAECEKDA